MTTQVTEQQRVIVVGGGYGGAALAAALDPDLEVVLVEPKDAFVHATAALRAVVDRDWQDRVFFPYDALLRRGRVVHDRARRVSPGVVHLSSTEVLTADYVVLATGTGYPFPAKYLEDRTEVAAAHLDRLREDLQRCGEVMVVGGGAVGLELAGELTAAHPDLQVTVVDSAHDVLTSEDYLPELRAAVRDQLAARGVRFVLGAPLGSMPSTDVGTYGPFEVATTAGERVRGQMWFRCYGSQPVTDYLDTELAAQRRGDGTLPVTEHLRVIGHDRLFAIGDITDVPESKRANAARDHAGVVAQNIRDLAAGREPSATYRAAREMIVLPLGPDGGASQLEQPDGSRRVVGTHETTRIKGADLFSGLMGDLFGLERS